MTEKFIKRHCEECEFAIREGWDRLNMELCRCGEITEEGEISDDIHKLTHCRKGWKK